jgi:uncharacterized protein YigA (DUF484 family)
MYASNYQLKNFYINDDKIIEQKNISCPWQSKIIEDLQRQLTIERSRNRELIKKIGMLEKKTTETLKKEPIIINIH